ncbi:hypothetical protein CR513_15077, partial [Mucuna pruriens]
MGQKRWMEFLKDYDFQLMYHLGKTNVVGAEKAKGFSLRADRVLRYKDKMCISQDQELERLVEYTPKDDKDVSRSQEDILVVRHEEGSNRVCGSMSDLSEGEGGTPKAKRAITVAGGPLVEMGQHLYRLRCKPATDNKGLEKCSDFFPINIKYLFEKLINIHKGNGQYKKDEICQENLRQYEDHSKKSLEFEEGNHMFLRVMLVTRVENSPKFLRYQILSRVGPISYQIALPPLFSSIYNVFHVSQLRKYIRDPTHVIELYLLQIREYLTYKAQSAKIMDQRLKQLRGKDISLVQMVWNEATRDST